MKGAKRAAEMTGLRISAARVMGSAALLALATFLYLGSALAETREVDVDCREGLTKKVALKPNEEEVTIVLTGCMCSFSDQSPADVKERLKQMAAAHMASALDDPQGPGPIFPVGGAPGFTYSVAPGETKELTFYCYTPEQEQEYLNRAVESLSSD